MLANAQCSEGCVRERIGCRSLSTQPKTRRWRVCCFDEWLSNESSLSCEHVPMPTVKSVKTPPAGASLDIAKVCQGSILSRNSCPRSQRTHIPSPGKTTRTKRQLQSCKSQPIMRAQGTCRAADRMMSGGKKEDQPLALYHFDIYMHIMHSTLRKSSQHDKLLSFLISTFCTLAKSELIP